MQLAMSIISPQAPGVSAIISQIIDLTSFVRCSASGFERQMVINVTTPCFEHLVIIIMLIKLERMEEIANNEEENAWFAELTNCSWCNRIF